MAGTITKDDTDDRLTNVAKKVGEDMKQHYGMGFEVFHERLRAEFDDNDEEIYIRFYIVFDGKIEDLEDRRRKGEIGRVRDLLSKVGISDFPVLSFVSRAEWVRDCHKLLVNA